MSPSQSYFSVTACHPRISLSLHVTVPHICLTTCHPHISLCHYMSQCPTYLCHYMSQYPTSLCHYMSQCLTSLCHYMSQCLIHLSVTTCHSAPTPLSLHVTVPPHLSVTTCHSAPHLSHYMSQCPHIYLSLHVTVPHTSLTTCHSAPHLSYYITMSSLPPFSPKHDSVA